MRRPLATGSRLGRTGAGFHSRCASGPWLEGPSTCGPDRLLGPCFKTGRQVSRQSPADPGHRDEVGTGRDRERTTRRRHRGRSRRAGLTRFPGDPAPLSGGQVRPVVPSTVGRPARRGRAVGSPAGHPVGSPAWPEEPYPAGICRLKTPVRSRAPHPGEVHAAEREGAPRPHRRGVPGSERGTAPSCVESPGPDLCGPPVCFSTASRTLELSLQSAFQLSLTVLVLYRSRACI